MLRILSDLHVRDASSRVRSLRELEPLFAGVEELWINGDCCDSQCGLRAEELAAIRRFFTDRVPRVRFLTGNHDPDISDLHHCSTADGRVWATHGDVFFDDIVPWSRLLPELRRRVAAARAAMPERRFDDLDDRLAIMRRALLGLRQHWDPEQAGLGHRLARLAGTLFPPRQPWAMLQAWRGFPDLVARRVADWQPGAQVMVAGHTHYPCLRRRGNLTVVNTGAFAGPFGAYCVDVAGDRVTVRLVRKQHGTWGVAGLVAELELGNAGRASGRVSG